MQVTTEHTERERIGLIPDYGDWACIHRGVAGSATKPHGVRPSGALARLINWIWYQTSPKGGSVVVHRHDSDSNREQGCLCSMAAADE